MRKIFAENLKSLRLTRGISQAEFAKLLNTSQQRISEWECGKNEPSLYNLLRIIDVLGVTFEDLVDGIKINKK